MYSEGDLVRAIKKLAAAGMNTPTTTSSSSTSTGASTSAVMSSLADAPSIAGGDYTLPLQGVSGVSTGPSCLAQDTSVQHHPSVGSSSNTSTTAAPGGGEVVANRLGKSFIAINY